MHPDNSLVEITAPSGTIARPYYDFRKTITDTMEAYAPQNVVAKVTDSGEVVRASRIPVIR